METNREKLKRIALADVPDTEGVSINGCSGQWYLRDYRSIDGHDFFLLSPTRDGGEAPCMVVDQEMEPSLTKVFQQRFDEYTVYLLQQEMMPVAQMPDPSISIKDMKKFGYSWGGMLPIRSEILAAEVMRYCTVYRLYGDDTESLALDPTELKSHAEQGGIFGVEKIDWLRHIAATREFRLHLYAEHE